MKFLRIKEKWKRGFIGVEYIIISAIVMIGGIGLYVGSQETIVDTQESGAVLLGDTEAELITQVGTTGNDLITAITVTPNTIYLDEIGDTSSATVSLNPSSSWMIGLNWTSYFNGGKISLTEENSGYKVTVKGLEYGLAKYQVATTDGSAATEILSVQVGQPSEFTITPSSPTIDEGESITVTLINSENLWDTMTIEGWSITSGSSLISIEPSLDGKSAVITADGTENGGTAIVKVSIYDSSFGTTHTAFVSISINEDYFTSFDSNGSGDTFTTLQAASSRETIIPEEYTPTKEGYIFVGWKLSLGGSIYQPGDVYEMPSQNNTMTAQWEAEMYTVVYDLNYDDKLHSTVSLAYETMLGSLPSVSRSGCTFLGWYTEAEGGELISESTLVPLNGATYYAHWSYNAYTITYDTNGGSGTYSNIVNDYLTEVALSATAPTRTGYTFTGWKSSFDNTVYSSGATFEIPYQNTTLTAQWEVNSYTVTFNANGGGTVSPTTITKNYGTALGTLPTVSRTGYTFKGWFTATSGGTQITSTTLMSGAATYYAQWTAISYTQTINYYKKVNGTWTLYNTATDSVAYGTTVYASNYKLTAPTGYEWYSYSSTSWTVTGAKTVSIYYTPLSYTIYFYGNNGTASVSSMTVTYDTPIGSMATATRSYYTFSGWYTTTSGGTLYSSTTTWTRTSNLSLYANWTGAYATINIYNDISKANAYSSSVSVGSSKTFSTPTQTGYTYKSLYNGSTSVVTVSSLTVTVKTTGTATVTINWYATLPTNVGTTYTTDSWTTTTRYLKLNNYGTDMTYYNNYLAAVSTLTSTYSSAGSAKPTSWTSSTTTAPTTWSFANSKYREYKACGITANADGTTRCSASKLAWIGTDTTAPKANGSSSWSYSGYLATWTWKISTDTLSSVRVNKIQASWYSGMTGTIYSVSYGGTNTYFANQGVTWGGYGATTYNYHNKASGTGAAAWLYMNRQDRDYAANSTGWYADGS